MEPVTVGENVLRGEALSAKRARQTHCKRGHLLDGDNLYVEPKSRRRACRICLKMKEQRRDRRRGKGERCASLL
jgi:hypothetical protein